MTDALTVRINQAVESLLDDETLTSELDDAAADTLIKWGSALAELIVSQTSSMDEPTADSFTLLRLGNARRLMRQVNHWISNLEGKINSPDKASALEEILYLAELIYPNFQPPSREQQQAFLRESFSNNPSEWIIKLRSLVEGTYGKTYC
ncbi:MAG: hypothetical protein N3E45_09445 [Oscillatoriaceae bacterium SKW80]|nr:hypothetical protein [Oscillatoriaceae bacterium SKYG93]MCX8121038.1 hypothetical protein [Oscillatoriaceae bacterium SKW80]MDW8452311.1 hypothetical protein [Oscillatoriaceae cyanobacterium SKYGB_i_bin93]HIK26645.1 hypothetical protein [Oscillatoriaceae cyanobacterium M7585_C2015_266]